VATPAISIRAIGREYGKGRERVSALSGVTFDVAPGEIVALLGANGAGKTTLVKILSTLLLPTGGSASILGLDVVSDVKAVRRRVGVVFGGERGFYTRLSARENMRFFGMLAGLSRVELRERIPVMLERVGLAGAADRRVETYSKGMRQRLHIALGLLPRPQVLLLDEPTVGLDPVEADRLRSTVAGLRDDGVGVLLTSHYLLDVEQLASRVVMLESGRVTADLPLPDFARRAGYAAVVVARFRGDGPAPAQRLPDGTSVDSRVQTESGTELTLRLRNWGGDVFTQLGALLDGTELLDIEVRPARLEEAFASFSRAGADPALDGDRRGR
jgi:ABC-2 type transport system ATP-binding protein